MELFLYLVLSVIGAVAVWFIIHLIREKLESDTNAIRRGSFYGVNLPPIHFNCQCDTRIKTYSDINIESALSPKMYHQYMKIKKRCQKKGIMLYIEKIDIRVLR